MPSSRKLGHLIAVTIFVVYLVVAVSYVLLPLSFDAQYVQELRGAEVWRSNLNLVPFRFGSDDSGSLIGEQALGNFLLGIPFGFGVPFVKRLRPLTVLLASALFGVGIEAFQLIENILGIAFPARVVDVNDVMLNATGAALGLGLFLACRQLYSKAWKSRAPGGPWRHFHEVLTGRWRATPPNAAP